MPHAGSTLALQHTIRHPVVLGIPDVDATDPREEAGSARRGVEQHRELLLHIHVCTRRSGHHVQHTLPHLVVTVGAAPAPAFQSLLYLGRRRV